jgi:hypothetical protein
VKIALTCKNLAVVFMVSKFAILIFVMLRVVEQEVKMKVMLILLMMLSPLILGFGCQHSSSKGKREVSSERKGVQSLSERMAELKADMEELTKDKSCTSNSECKAMAYGTKACGGPSGYVVYSIKTTDVIRLKEVTSELSQLQDEYNREQGLMSTCSYMMPPEVSCDQGQCRAH